MEARDSQRELMRLAALDKPSPSECSSSSTRSAPETANRRYLDLSIRNKIQAGSTVTSLESLASSIDLRDEPGDKNLKRNRDIITEMKKESQLKEQRTTFRGLFSTGDSSKGLPKKTRKNDDN